MIEKEMSVNSFRILVLEMKGDWDRDSNFIVPEVSEPDWTKEEALISKQREFLK